jgi:adenosylhomocysteine nucleosidase
MLIAITFALPDESKELVHELRHPGVASSSSHLPIVLGNLGRHEVLIVHTGVGRNRAKAVAEKLFLDYRPDRLISAGFAGGLDPAVPATALVLAQNLSDAAMLEKARVCVGLPVYCGGLYTCNETLETTDAKAKCFAETKAVAVDMESEEIVRVAQRYGVPALTLRAVSDSAKEPLPVPFLVWFDDVKQRPKVGALVRYLLRHPSVVPEFARFVRNVGAAKKALTSALVNLVEAM